MFLRKVAGCFAFSSLTLVAGTASATQYLSVQESVSGVKGQTLDVTAHCPAGFTPTGGGFDMYPGDHQITYVSSVYFVGSDLRTVTNSQFVPRVVIAISRPNDAGDGWRVAGFLNDDLTLYAWARCASLN